MRKEVPEIGWGRFHVLPIRQPGDPGCCATSGATTRSCSCTTSATSRSSSSFPAQASHGRSGLLVNLLSEDHSVAGTDGKHHLQLERYGYRWYPRRRTGLPAPAQRGLGMPAHDAETVNSRCGDH